MADYLDELSSFVCETRFKDLDEPAVRATKDVLMDTFGAILAGSCLSENARLARFAASASGRATCTILGHPERADPIYATLVNSTAGVGLEQDEGNRWGGGHPAIHVVPGAVAVGEEMAIDGRRLAESVVVGYELVSRIGSGMRPRLNVQLHGTFGSIGTAVAVAKLLDYNQKQVRELINIAACMAPANPFMVHYEGATIRNLYLGRSGLQGILAVKLHQAGFTGLRDGPSAVYGTILGESFDPEKVVQGMGNGLRIQQNYFKIHAACRSIHPTLDAVISLARRGAFTYRDVDWVRVTTLDIPFAPKVEETYPRNILSSKFSTPYAVAATLVRGKADVTSFYDDAISDPRIRELFDKVEVTYDSQMSAQRSEYPTARVAIGLKNGRSLDETTMIVRGDAMNPLSREELVSKFVSLATPSLGAQTAERVVEMVGRVEELKDIRELTYLMGVREASQE